MRPDEIQAHFQKGVKLFRDRHFFDAHEELEEFWNYQKGEMKTFAQGMIQAAVACHHLVNRNVRGAVSLYRSAREKLTPHSPDYHGIRVDLLIEEMDSTFGPMDPNGPPPETVDPDQLPRPQWK